MTDFKEIEPLKVNGITVAEVSEGGTELLIIDRVWPEEAPALHAWLTRALYGEGYKLVPVEPTKEMMAAGQNEHDNCIDEGYGSDADGNRHNYTTISPDAPYKIYAAMLSASPIAD